MRFIDSNIFLHAFLIPSRQLTREEQLIKDEAKAIVKRVEEGEEVALTTVHLSEVVNIIEAGLDLHRSLRFLAWAVTSENIKVYPVTAEDYGSAIPLAEDKSISANDALAYLIMKAHGMNEIYTFDRHFGQLREILKLPQSKTQ
ncbi:type II toxin-antitoxin system VapC family toxin [Candidatus Bathyarchaeota archaeon]|nr:type II toxin-antitoxin system VapC family toxin [Candidatus Bathyarchaeota archaeon]